MGYLKDIIQWHSDNSQYIDFFKDVIFLIGVFATFYGYFKFLKFLAQRKTLNKRQEMENDLKTYSEVHSKLKEHVDGYNARPGKLRDIGIRLLHIKNYPYKLHKDGYSQMLYYYFLSENHQATGYISGKGLYVMEHLWFFGNAIYYNEKNSKWFVDDKGKKFKHYRELKAKQLVKRIPFSNILGYDFNSDWADKGEPVFYTKYLYYKWRLYADDFEAVDIDKEYHLAFKVELKRQKRTRRIRTLLKRLTTKITILKNRIKRQRKLKPKKRKK